MVDLSPVRLDGLPADGEAEAEPRGILRRAFPERTEELGVAPLQPSAFVLDIDEIRSPSARARMVTPPFRWEYLKAFWSRFISADVRRWASTSMARPGSTASTVKWMSR